MAVGPTGMYQIARNSQFACLVSLCICSITTFCNASKLYRLSELYRSTAHWESGCLFSLSQHVGYRCSVHFLKFTVSAPMDMFLCQTMLVLIGAKPILDLHNTENAFLGTGFTVCIVSRSFFLHVSPPSGDLPIPAHQLSPIIEQLPNLLSKYKARHLYFFPQIFTQVASQCSSVV